jgi:rhamnosyltransferase
MGLGYAHNQGIKKSRELGANMLLILDHDSVLKPYFVNELLNTINDLKSKGVHIGAVGPIYCNEQTNETYPITKYWGPLIKRLYPIDNPVEASVLISSEMLISIEVINDIGGMNEGLFVDYIDIEWSYRARKNGYHLFVSPKAVMNHQIGDKRMSVLGRRISVHSPVRRYYLTRNSIHMLRISYIHWGYKLREIFFIFLRIVIFVIVSPKRKEYFKYSFYGFRDGLKGIYGNYRN